MIQHGCLVLALILMIFFSKSLKNASMNFESERARLSHAQSAPPGCLGDKPQTKAFSIKSDRISHQPTQARAASAAHSSLLPWNPCCLHSRFLRWRYCVSSMRTEGTAGASGLAGCMERERERER